jgi:hypothetical protein
MAIQPPPVPADPRRFANQIPPQPKPIPPQPAPSASAEAATAMTSSEPAAATQTGIAPENPEMEIKELPHEDQRSFWQQPFVQNVLPFLTSLVLHIGVIVFGYMMLKVGQAVVVALRQEQIIVPEAEMVASGPEGGIPHPGLGGDPTRDAAQDKFPDVPKDSKGLAEKPGPTLQVSLIGGGGGEADGQTAIGLGANVALGSGSGVGAGLGQGYGSGVGDGTGALAPFGVPGGGGGLGPKSNFIGLGGYAKRIAYVCDASGSMLNMFDSLRVELRKSIENLRPIQSFNVVFFQDQGFKAADVNTLVMGNPENKRKVYDFLDKMFVRGETNPIPALEAVSKMQPELIYLLTDGDFSGPGNQAVIDFCQKQFGQTKTKINTIAFIAKESKDNPQDLEYVKALQQIAKNSGGQFKHVTDDDMGQR